MPKSFGELGFYRADALKQISGLEPKYVGAETCGDCHDDVYETKANSFHKGVACEACHGEGKELSPDKVHSISNPYKPPYPREPEE